MNNADKLLRKLNTRQRRRIEFALLQLYAGQLSALSVKRLRGHKNLYRIRVGDYRIVYKEVSGRAKLVDIYKRDDQTYRDF